jgi:phosphatidylserine decarboxylase
MLHNAAPMTSREHDADLGHAAASSTSSAPARRRRLDRVTQHEQLNFWLTNRLLPRRAATLFVGWLSRIENPLVLKPSLWLWQLFAGDLRLDEAKAATFKSLRDCFTRELKAGARPIAGDAGVVVSPCDAIVGACGRIHDTEVLQIKGFRYELGDLLRDERLVAKYRDGVFVTLRLTSSMYHRFHAPADCRVREVIYISGDTWNVNSFALRRIERLFCKNERAVVDLDLGKARRSVALVPVAAILVASIRLHCLPEPLTLRYRGPNRIPCDRSFRKGEEMGYFEQGSTIVVFATQGFELYAGLEDGAAIRMGEPLMKEL